MSPNDWLDEPYSLTDGINRSRNKFTSKHYWDVIVIGAGITGAGIARESARRGWSTLVVDNRDLAGGTSNFSSKMVHGGLRYLAQGHIGLTRQATRAREALMLRWPDLVTPMPYYFIHHRGRGQSPTIIRAGLWLYYLLSGASDKHRPASLSANELAQRLRKLDLAPSLGASQYFDATCDDSQLVLRTLQEALAQGADISHYTEAKHLARDNNGVSGVVIQYDGNQYKLKAKVVINATGVWTDELTPPPMDYQLQPQRGSHLMFPWKSIPIHAALTLYHPRDQRMVFCYPWAGVTVVGTTDLFHDADRAATPRITGEERHYLRQVLPLLGVSSDLDALGSWSGLRPIMTKSSKSQSPSDASREHMIWSEPGLVSVAGGKLTTFVEMANEVLEHAAQQRRLPKARIQADTIIRAHMFNQMETIDNTQTSENELQYWAKHGAVEQLTDLLLRRTRLGWVLGAALSNYQTQIQTLCQPHLRWDEPRWQAEWQSYWRYWRYYHQEPASSEAAIKPNT